MALDRLVHELWRDNHPLQATLSLQSYISRLRRTISDAHRGGEVAPRIVTRAPGWALVMPAEQVDAVRFAGLVREGNALVEGGRGPWRPLAASEALALWPVAPPSRTSTTCRSRWGEGRLRTCGSRHRDSAVGRPPDLGRPGGVVERPVPWWRRQPVPRTGVVCPVWRSIARAGGRTRWRWRGAPEVLAEGLGLDPVPGGARDLQVQILDQDARWTTAGSRGPAIRPSDCRDRHPGAGPDHPLPPCSSAAGPRRALEHVNRTKCRAEGRFVVVEGPAGIGKSVIRAGPGRRVRASGGLVLRGGGVGAGAAPALWPWVAVLRQLVAAEPETRRRRLAPEALIRSCPSSIPASAPVPDSGLTRGRTGCWRGLGCTGPSWTFWLWPTAAGAWPCCR